jgi:uncharacterized protein involved in exopolysaccharide biosynthesis
VRNQQTLAARIEEKDQEVNNLTEQMGKMKELVQELNHAISFYKPVFDSEMKRLNPQLDWSDK